MYKRMLLAASLAAALPVFAAPINLIQNGSFETNGGANSDVLPGWTTVVEENSNGTWVAQTGRINPVTSTCGPDEVEPPPDGAFAAMMMHSAPGSHALYQDVAIPAGANPILTFQFYIGSKASLSSPESLSSGVNPNQQFRVDVIDPAANEFTLNVLQTVLVVGTGNPRKFGYDTHSVPVVGLGGRRVRIRFVEVDNQFCFYAGVDNVRLELDAVPVVTSIVRFTSSQDNVNYGGAATLTWITENATSVEIDNGVGPVALSGSRSVSLQSSATYTLTASGPLGTVRRAVNIEVRQPGPTIRFNSSPDFIQRGQPSTLTWSTTDAETVSIDNGIGAVASSGSLTVTPQATTEYTLTATGSGATTTARTAVFVDPGDVPIVSVTSFAQGIVGVAGSPGALTTTFALTNLGRIPTAITLTQSGAFFSQSPSSLSLPADATQVVTITINTAAAGKYEGASIPAGAGVPAGLVIPVRLFLAAAPSGTVLPSTSVARTEIAAPANENPSGSVSFSNAGTGTLQGIVTSDVAWLIPQTDAVVIGPGAAKNVTFTTNRALRPDAASAGGAAVGTLTLSYVDFSGSSSKGQATLATGGQGSISTTVIDVVKASATPAAPQPLAPGEIALFVPGLAQIPGSSGDLLLSVIGNSIGDLRLYLGAPGAAPILGSIDQIAPNAGLSLPSILQSVFASNAANGTVQARSASIARVSLAGLQTNTGSAIGSFITALPTFRSDRSAAPGEMIYLAGVERGLTRTTNVFVQEVGGLAATAVVEYLSASGDVVSRRAGEDIAAFAVLSLPDSVPAGVASVRITNASRTAARIVGYATVVDGTTKDAWTIVDSQSMIAASAEQIVAVPPPPAGAAITSNVLYVLNPGSTSLEISIEDQFRPARHRAARNEVSATAATTTVGPMQTIQLPIGFSNGFNRMTASRPFVVSARSMQFAPGRGGSFGSALPALPASAALAPGQSRRFGSVEDAGRATVAAATPITYRSNLGLIESSGQPATVRLTLRYTFSAGSKSSAQGLSTVSVQVPGNRLLMVNGIARSVIGASRDNYGDLRNMQLDVEVISANGRVFPFLQTIDNGSADSAIRVQ